MFKLLINQLLIITDVVIAFSVLTEDFISESAPS